MDEINLKLDYSPTVIPDYSTQQIKYKDPGKPEIEEPPVQDHSFEEKPLLQDRYICYDIFIGIFINIIR